MRFFSLLFLLFSFSAHAGLKDVILSREYGSCETNNLSFSAMKFYKIPAREENHFLRILLFFNADKSVVVRKTLQELLGCQTTSSGEEVCSYRPKKDEWNKKSYTNDEQSIDIPDLGFIKFTNPDNINRGFQLILDDHSFIGGMVVVNFNQDGVNTATICK